MSGDGVDRMFEVCEGRRIAAESHSSHFQSPNTDRERERDKNVSILP